jgi:cholesterol 24(S)-hydroxylase
LGDEPKDVLPSVEETKKMTYINQVMKETLRINDPAPRVVPRLVTEDTVLPSGLFVPKGSLVTVNIFNLHHSEKVWKNSNQFNPDRFTEDGEASREAGEGMTWIPFGNGARQCLGMNFSLNEQRVLLSMLCKSLLNIVMIMN